MTVAEKSDNESSDEETDCECDEQQNDDANLDAQKKKIAGRSASHLPPAGFRFYNLAMEIFVETLTGTVFQLRVSPFETIMSVKAKIQRIEGIPILQQHLIYQSAELEDDYCLHDYNISDGATLKLVLAMRGGPINTRRIPMEDSNSFREMTEFMEATHDDLWEQLPGNGQVTLLVFREGDHINFFRVVDRGDGTLTPLSESIGGPSGLYGLPYPDNSETDDEIDAKIVENDNTKEKMRNLLAKMKTSKKSKGKKLKKSHSRPGSSAHRPSSKSSRANRTPTPRDSKEGAAGGPSEVGVAAAPRAAPSVFSSHLRRSGANVRLPPVLSSSRGASTGHEETYSRSTSNSFWQSEYLPEIMKRALQEQEEKEKPGAVKSAEDAGALKKSHYPSEPLQVETAQSSAVTVPPSQNECTSASPSVSNAPSSVSLTSPSSCSSATSSVAPPTAAAPAESSSLPPKAINGRPRVTPASTAAVAPDDSLNRVSQSNAPQIPSNFAGLDSTYPPVFPRHSSSKMPLHATTSNIPSTSNAKSQTTPRARPNYSGKKERTIEELWGYWKKHQTLDDDGEEEVDEETDGEKETKKSSTVGVATDNTNLSRVGNKTRSGTGLPSVGSEPSFAPHPPSLPPPSNNANGNGILSFRNYKPQHSLGNRNQDDQVFEDWRQSRQNGSSFPFAPHPPTGPSPRRSSNSASQGAEKETSSASRKYYEYHDLYGQIPPRSPSATHSGRIRLSSRGGAAGGRVGQPESGKKSNSNNNISSGNENLRGKGPPSGQIKQSIPAYGRIPSNSSFTHNDFMASLLSETARLRLSSKGQRNVISPNGTRIHSSRRLSSRGGLVSPPRGTRLPPVGANNNSANVKKQKLSKRCVVCNKKTGLATSYNCRCGNNFCAAHRYAEAHNCTFDYKMEGRKILEQNNPVVTAPKLPKI